MYVTGGQYKGCKIIVPNCAKPTLSKTRESVFNVLFSYFGDFSGKKFLDLYSGSGVMSLEALSRGFETVSVDKNKSAISVIKNNLKIAKGGYKIVLQDSCRFLKTDTDMFDVIYIDPPWENDYKEALSLVFSKYKESVVIIEYDKKRAREMSENYAQNIVPFREKVYGRCKLDFIKIP